MAISQRNTQPWMEPMTPDWIWSSASSVHVAKDLRWFTDYVLFATDVRTILGGRLLATGIGTVHLPTRCGKKNTNHTVMTLKDVLHVPGAFCNILAGQLIDGCPQLKCLKNAKGHIVKNGIAVALLLPNHPLLAVRISAPPLGPVLGDSVFVDGMLYMVNVFWEDSERRRWQCRQHGYSEEELDVLRNWPYTADERAWLKSNFRGESRFLRMYNLDSDEEEDCNEGRQMVREMMAIESDAKADAKDSFVSSLPDILDDVLSQTSSFVFTEGQLNVMIGKYGGPVKFMKSLRLKFYKPDDFAVAVKSIAPVFKKRNERITEVVDGLKNLGLRSIFTPPERRYIERRYGEIDKFMERFALDATNDRHCEEAKAIVARRLEAQGDQGESDEACSP